MRLLGWDVRRALAGGCQCSFELAALAGGCYVSQALRSQKHVPDVLATSGVRCFRMFSTARRSGMGVLKQRVASFTFQRYYWVACTRSPKQIPVPSRALGSDDPYPAASWHEDASSISSSSSVPFRTALGDLDQLYADAQCDQTGATG